MTIIKIIIRNKKGFTLIELLVVISIIGMLSGIILQSLNSARMKARNIQRLSDIESIATGFQIATTGGTNMLPNSAWSCLGKNPCAGGTYNTALNNLLKTGMSGGVIPTDPLWKTGLGDAYLYGGDNSIYGGRLYWYMEVDPSNQSNTTCGRGIPYGLPNTARYACMLFLGPSGN